MVMAPRSFWLTGGVDWRSTSMLTFSTSSLMLRSGESLTSVFWESGLPWAW
jgi:hypothetical protein